MSEEPSAIGIIGGSGLYQMEELCDATAHMACRHACSAGCGSIVRAMGLRGAERCVSL